MSVITSLEEQARAVGNDRKALRRRLKEAVPVCLEGDFERGSRFDFKSKRLYSGGSCYLQWRLRMEPEAPVSCRNQQTSRGIVTVEWPEIDARIQRSLEEGGKRGETRRQI